MHSQLGSKTNSAEAGWRFEIKVNSPNYGYSYEVTTLGRSKSIRLNTSDRPGYGELRTSPWSYQRCFISIQP